MWRTAGSPKVSANNPFTDVKSTDYYYNAVLWAVQNNITSGISATQFAPNEPVSRAQMACFLYKQAGNPKLAGYFVFTDVSEKSYYYNAVHWARQKEITSGTSDNCFLLLKAAHAPRSSHFSSGTKNGLRMPRCFPAPNWTI